ncbi:MAG: outer membrane lipoprotein carrier protein LolA [Pseudomonadota bacterium]
MIASLASLLAIAVVAAPIAQTPPQNQPNDPPRTLDQRVQPPPAYADLTDEEVLEKVADYIEGIETLQATFSQFSSSGGSATGVVKLKRPGLMRFTYDPPATLNIVANDGLVYVEDTELETTDSYPLRETPLKFLLRRKVRTGDLRLIEVDRSPDLVSIGLTSTETELEGSISLVFNAPELELRQWVVYEPDGRSTYVVLRDIRRDIDIPNREFRAPEAGSTFLSDR